MLKSGSVERDQAANLTFNVFFIIQRLNAVSSHVFVYFNLDVLYVYEHWTLNTEFIAHLQLDSRIAEYIIKVQ